MKFYRCKCGAHEAYGSMPPHPCSGCEKCGTTLEQHPDDHRAPRPHEWQTDLVETDEGKRKLTRCSWCGVQKPYAEIMKDRELADMRDNWDYQNGPNPHDK